MASYQVSLDGALGGPWIDNMQDAIEQARSAVDCGQSRRAKIYESDGSSTRLAYKLEGSGAPLEEVQERPLPEASRPGPRIRPSELAERMRSASS
jgi:hypothetical protein